MVVVGGRLFVFSFVLMGPFISVGEVGKEQAERNRNKIDELSAAHSSRMLSMEAGWSYFQKVLLLHTIALV